MSNSSHIAVLALPFTSHTASLLNLVRSLAPSAPYLRFSFFSTSKALSSVFSGFDEFEFDNVKAYSVWDGMPDGHDFSENFKEELRVFFEAMPGNYETAVKVAEEETGKKITCFLTHASLWFAGDLAEKRGVPWVPFWPANSPSLSVHFYTDVIRGELHKTGKAGKAVETLEFLPGLEAIHINDVPQIIRQENDFQSPMGRLFHTIALNLPSATAVVIHSFEEIDPIVNHDLKSKLQKVLNIGPLPSLISVASSSNENECIQWLENQNPVSVVYISFGTAAIPPPNEIVALGEALETIKVPFLWSLTDHTRKILPDELVDRVSRYGKFVSWAPQLQVLKHSSVGAHVTHGGWNSVFESITSGVPMICRSLFADQMINSRMVQEIWKIGLSIGSEGFTKEGTIDALNLVLKGQRRNEMRENLEGLQEKALDAIKPNGSSTRNFQALLKLIASPIASN